MLGLSPLENLFYDIRLTLKVLYYLCGKDHWYAHVLVKFTAFDCCALGSA